MKKKIVLAVLTAALAAMAVLGCSSKDAGASDTDAAQEETVMDGTAEDNMAVDPEESAEAETSTVTGTLDEVKDFMFTVTDDDGTPYAFTYEQGSAPEGLDAVSVGDRVVVTYTGEVSEVDAFNGEVLMVEPAE
ncbi:MAG: hypothetical protein Q4C82_08875 [Eubacteriales bacterium]|nr:hypothetical protein [Eubacteriales bacterium]